MPASFIWQPGPTGGTPTNATNLNKLAVTADLGTAGTPAGDAIRAASLPKWKPSTVYASGEFVLNPSGQVVSANTAFTSGTTYSASNWTIVAGGGAVSSVAGRTGAVTLAKSDVGLGNVDNTADTAKPVSTAQATALAAKAVIADIPTAGTATGDALSAAFGSLPDQLTLHRLQRLSTDAQRASGGQAQIDYADAVEVDESWANLTAWTQTNMQVSSNKLFAVAAANPTGAVQAFSVPAGGKAHAQAIINWVAGGSGDTIYFGVDCGTAGHTPVTNTPEGILVGLGSAHAHNTFLGSNVQALSGYSTVINNDPSPTVNTTYLATVDVDENYISLSLKVLGSTTSIWSTTYPRSALTGGGKTINNLLCYISDSRGLSGHSLSPVVAVHSQQPARTKAIAGTTVEGVDVRHISTRNSSTSDAWHVVLPANYDARRPSPLVLWTHQATGSVSQPWADSRMQATAAALSAAGYIVAIADAGGSSADEWGNQTDLDDQVALYQYVRDHFNVGALFLLATSMGGIVALNLLAQRKLPTPQALAFVSGVYNLDLLYAQSAFTAGINTAFGITGGTTYAAATAGYNPVKQPGYAFRGVPVRAYQGSTDVITTDAGNAAALIASVAPYTTDATEVVVNSVGHLDASLFQPSNLVAFFESHRTAI